MTRRSVDTGPPPRLLPAALAVASLRSRPDSGPRYPQTSQRLSAPHASVSRTEPGRLRTEISPEPRAEQRTGIQASAAVRQKTRTVPPRRTPHWPADIAFLVRFGLSPTLLDHVVRRAKENGTTAPDELFALSTIPPSFYWRCLARDLKIAFISRDTPMVSDPKMPPPPAAALANPNRALVIENGRRLLLLAPGVAAQAALRRAGYSRPDVLERIRIAEPATIRAVLEAAHGRSLVYCARRRLAHAMPRHSAAHLPRRRIAARMIAVLALLFAVLVAAPLQTWIGLDIAFALLFLHAIGWKSATTLVYPRPPPAKALPDAQLPVVSVLVPLYREANVVDDLVAALVAIEYPVPKRELILIVESDDAATRAAVARHADVPGLRIITVPAAQPRTKPKALVFALPFCRGEVISVFDAEDRPEPGQLRVAAAALAADKRLGCVQARLQPDNPDSWLARMFAIEYAGNFEVLLPALAAWGMPLPLGGTSNHFSRAALERVGAWDPYNVTEDADLGIRLARFGYRTAMIASRTYEEAPV
ncbi:MAG: glycosyltransferase, partial [Alphaproteobacteria bacterium]